MGITRILHMTFFFLLFTTFLNLVSCYCPAPDKNRALFILGDQHFDVGNNHHIDTKAQANFKPYGSTFFNYSSGRFSDGRLICDFIAEYMGLPPIRPYLEGDNSQFICGANFASALSGALPETNKKLFPVIDLPTQLSYFQNMTTTLREKLGEGPFKEVISNAIYLFSVGTNDYFAPFIPSSGDYDNVPYDHGNENLSGWVIKSIINVTKEIYNMGGRKFGFLNVGPLDRYPFFQPLRNIKRKEQWEPDYLSLFHNMDLSSALVQMQKENDGFRYAVHNLYDFIYGRMNKPSQDGFKEKEVACCGSGVYNGDMTCGGRGGYLDYSLCDNPNDYLFFDGLDFSEQANKQIAELFWNGTSSVTGPNNLKSLLD